MTFSGKTCLIDNIKSHKKVGFLSLCLSLFLSLSLSLENKFLEKPHGGGGGCSKIDPHQA